MTAVPISLAIRFQVTDYEQNISFNDSVMVAPEAGIYHFDFFINNAGYTVSNNGSNSLITFRILSSTNQARMFIYPIYSETNGQVFYNGGADIYLVAGEAVKFQVSMPTSSSSISVGAGLNSFSGHLVR